MVVFQRAFVVLLKRKIRLGGIWCVFVIGFMLTGCLNGQKDGHWEICSCIGDNAEICRWGGDECKVGDQREEQKQSRD